MRPLICLEFQRFERLSQLSLDYIRENGQRLVSSWRMIKLKSHVTDRSIKSLSDLVHSFENYLMRRTPEEEVGVCCQLVISSTVRNWISTEESERVRWNHHCWECKRPPLGGVGSKDQGRSLPTDQSRSDPEQVQSPWILLCLVLLILNLDNTEVTNYNSGDEDNWCWKWLSLRKN